MCAVGALAVALLLVYEGHVAAAVIVERQQEEAGADLERSGKHIKEDSCCTACE